MKLVGVVTVILFVVICWLAIGVLSGTVDCLYIPVEVTNPYCLEIR